MDAELQFKSMVDPSVISSLSDRDLAKSIIDYKQRQKQLEEEVDKCKDIYKDLEAELLQRYEQEGQTSGTFFGADGRKHTLYMNKSLQPISKFSYSDIDRSCEFQSFVKLWNDGELAHTLNRTSGETMKGIRGVIKELYERDGKLPDGFDKFVEVRTEYKIGMRTS